MKDLLILSPAITRPELFDESYLKTKQFLITHKLQCDWIINIDPVFPEKITETKEKLESIFTKDECTILISDKCNFYDAVIRLIEYSKPIINNYKAILFLEDDWTVVRRSANLPEELKRLSINGHIYLSDRSIYDEPLHISLNPFILSANLFKKWFIDILPTLERTKDPEKQFRDIAYVEKDNFESRALFIFRDIGREWISNKNLLKWDKEGDRMNNFTYFIKQGKYITYSKLGENGRLGNSLFQIETTIAYALDTGKYFIFPDWKYLKYFKTPLPIGAPHTITNVYKEPYFHYTEISKLGGNVDLFGYFQSELYFKKHREKILTYLTLKDEYENYINKKYGQHLKENTCSIHVRRGDYCEEHTKEYHGLLTMDYYNEAIGKITNDNLKNTLFLIFSDDISWCKENFKLPNMIFIEGEEDIIDLFIMSKCKNNIIANSSFSWQAAWLNQNKNKKVIAPAKWFNNQTIDSQDIYCVGWDTV